MTLTTHRLDELCDLVKGTYPTLKTPPGPYPLVVTGAQRRSADSYQLDCAAVCVPLVSSTGHGDAAIHRLHFQDGKFALANLMVALVPRDSSRCDAKYLYYLLSAKKDSLLVPLMKGTSNVSLKVQDVASVEVSIPALDEQRRIVARIEELNAKIEKVRQFRGQNDTLLSALLSSAYRKLTHDAPRLPMQVVAPLVRRPVATISDATYAELGVRSFGKGTFHKPILTGIEIGTKRLFSIEPGDLVFNIVFAWEGAVAVARPEDHGRVGSHRFLTCVTDPELAVPEFLWFHFLTNEGLAQLDVASPGGAGRNRTLGLRALQQIEVPVPSRDKQTWFASLLAQAKSARDLQSVVDAELNGLLSSILHRPFTGVN